MCSSSVADDMRFKVMENQQQRSFGDHAQALFNCNTGKHLRITDHMEEQKNRGFGAAASASKAKAKAKSKEAKNSEAAAASDSDEDELSPMEKAMAKEHATPTKLKKAGGKGGKGAGKAAQALSPGGSQREGPSSGGIDSVTAQLLAEGQRELDVFKSLVKLDQGCEESLSSLESRLQSKRTALAKNACNWSGGDTLEALDTVSSTKAKMQAIVEIVKSVLAYKKERVGRPHQHWKTHVMRRHPQVSRSTCCRFALLHRHCMPERAY